MNSMTYKIKYLPLAVQDLNDIARYLSGFYPKTASRVLKEMRDKITKLGDNPKMCEIYPLDPVYRKWSLTSILYFIRSTTMSEPWRFTVFSVVRGIFRSIWNKRFGFECCGECSTTKILRHSSGEFLFAADGPFALPRRVPDA